MKVKELDTVCKHSPETHLGPSEESEPNARARFQKDLREQAQAATLQSPVKDESAAPSESPAPEAEDATPKRLIPRIEAPQVTISKDGKVTFNKGENTFAELRDVEHPLVRMSMDTESAENARRLGVTKNQKDEQSEFQSAQWRPTPLEQVLKVVTPVKAEQKLFTGKKHGIEWKEAMSRANQENILQGKWNDADDFDYVGRLAATMAPDEKAFFDLRAYSTATVYFPDGGVRKARHVFVKNTGTGRFYAYPALLE